MPDEPSPIPLPAPAPIAPSEAVGRPRKRRQAVPVTTRLLSASASVVVHVLLVAALTVIVWRTTAAPRPVGPSVQIDLDNPTFGDAPMEAPSGEQPGEAFTQPAGEIALALEHAPDPAPSPAPAPAIALNSLITLDAPAAPIEAAIPTGLGADTFALDGAWAHTGGSPGGVVAAAPADAGARAGGVSFGGLGASNARSVVYVVDGSGSMVTSLPIVITEVLRSVSRLAPTQKFGVVLFRRLPDGTDGVEVFAPVLVRATSSARERLADWLASIEPSGRSTPLAGLERALAYQPDAVFLLSRSIERSGGNVWDRGYEQTLARVDVLNPSRGDRRAVVIQTIQFLDEDPSGIMQAIGRVHGSRPDGAGGMIPGYRLIGRSEDLAGGSGAP